MHIMSEKKGFTKILYLLIGIVILFAASPLLFHAAEIPYKDDCDYLFALFEALRKTLLEYGEFPFWNPWCHGGVPLYANSNASIFSIEMLCVLLFGTFYGLRFAVFCYGLLGAFGMYLFLGDYTKNAYARFYGACIFPMAGCFSLHVINGHFVFLGFAYLPVLFWFVRRMGKREWEYAAGTGVIAGFLLNHNIHYTSLFSLFAAGIMGLPVLFYHYKERCFWKNVLLACMVMFAIGGYRLLISADFMFDYPRVLEDAVTIPFRNLILALVCPFQDPNWHLHANKTFCWAWHEIGCYTGVFALVLAFYSFIKKVRWYHYGILIAGMLTLDSRCCYLPGYWLRKIPAFSSCWVITRWRFLLIIFLILAAVIGLTKLLQQKSVSKKKLYVLLFISVGMTAASQFWTYGYSVPHVTENKMKTLPVTRPAGNQFVTMVVPGNSMYACVHHNIGNLSGYEVTLGYRHKSTFGHFPIGMKEYIGEFYAHKARMTHWSPNKIKFYADAPTLVRINSNTGNYWRINGMQLFPSERAFEEKGVFIFSVNEPGYYELSAIPKIHTFALYFSLISALIALLIIFTDIRKKGKKLI